MAMVDVDGGSHLTADSQPKSIGLVANQSASSNEPGELSYWQWS